MGTSLLMMLLLATPAEGPAGITPADSAEEAAKKAVVWAVSEVNDGKEFALAEARIACQQLITWRRTVHAVRACAAFLLLAISVLAIIAITAEPAGDGSAAFFALLAGFGAITWGVIEVHYLLQLWLAPKIYILEYCRDFVAG